jgi:hypothetical protein
MRLNIILVNILNLRVRTPLTSLIAVFISLNAVAQFPGDTLGNVYDNLEKKNRGSITMSDSTILNGYVDYNIFKDVLYFGTNIKKVNKVISARDVRTFEFFDEQLQKQKVYVSCQTPNGMEFFELLRNGKDHAIVTRTFPTRTRISVMSSTPTLQYNSALSFSFVGFADWRRYQLDGGTSDTFVTVQRMVLCVVFGREIKPFVLYTKKDVDNVVGTGIGWSGQRSRKKILDRKIPQQLCGHKYDAASNFALNNDLSWKEIDDVLRMFDYLGL